MNDDSNERCSGFIYQFPLLSMEDFYRSTDIGTSIESSFKGRLVEMLKDNPVEEIPVLQQIIFNDEDDELHDDQFDCFFCHWINNIFWFYNIDELYDIFNEYIPEYKNKDMNMHMLDFRYSLWLRSIEWKKEIHALLIKFGLDRDFYYLPHRVAYAVASDS